MKGASGQKYGMCSRGALETNFSEALHGRENEKRGYEGFWKAWMQAQE